MRKVLLITRSFPPRNHTSAKRVGCFAKFLPQYDWTPVVVTTLWTHEAGATDPDYVKNLPADLERVELPPESRQRPSIPAILFMKARYYLVPHLLSHKWWLRAAKELRRLFEIHHFSAIWATFPDHGALSHSLGAWASKRWQVPWIADFRDIHGQYKIESRRDRLHHLVEVAHERRMLRGAAAVVTVTSGLAEKLEKRHKRPIHVIPNGFDPDDYPATDRQRRTRQTRFNLVYAGTLRRAQGDPRLVLDAISVLAKEGSLDPREVMLDFYGTKPSLVEHFMSGHELRSNVRIHERVSGAQMKDILSSAAILLQLSSPGNKGVIFSKIYEYLGAGRPILSVPKDHDCNDALLEETGSGFSCSDVSEIAQRLGTWYSEWKTTGTIELASKPEAIEGYSRKHHAGMLARLLDEVSL